jgi:negative regulator of flagellin synthesis FlgM
MTPPTLLDRARGGMLNGRTCYGSRARRGITMRIDPTRTNAAPPPAERAQTAARPAVEAPSRAPDRVEVSDRSREVRHAAEAAAQGADVRAERVGALKQQIEQGTYQVDSTVLAEKLLNHI